MLTQMKTTAKRRSKVQRCEVFVVATVWGPKVALWNNGDVEVLFVFRNGKKRKVK